MHVLLVGLEYTGSNIAGVAIETKGLCRLEVAQSDAASALYDYDVIINPASYSHFIFGHETSHSDSREELRDLKHQNHRYDIDTIFKKCERVRERGIALRKGSRLICLASWNKRIQFYGLRSSYDGYLSENVTEFLNSCSLHEKRSKQISLKLPMFSRYFERLNQDGWSLCWNYPSRQGDDKRPLANTPEGYWLGNSISINTA